MSGANAGNSSNADENKYTLHKQPMDDGYRTSSMKSTGSGFLNRAGRTFSFGQKKGSASSPKEETIPEVPPIPTFHRQDPAGRSRTMTESTTSTATPPKIETDGGLDLGGDFGSMFSNFDKRASTSTVKQDGQSAPRALTGQRNGQFSNPTLDSSNSAENSLDAWNSHGSHDKLLPPSPSDDRPPPVPQHRSSPKPAPMIRRPSDIVEDEDARLIQDSISAGQYLSSSNSMAEPVSSRYRRNDDTSYSSINLSSSFSKDDDNMFESSMARISRVNHRHHVPRPQPPPSTGNKVMTPAQFENYRRRREQLGTESGSGNAEVEDEEDEINYDDDEDETEKSKQQAKQRRKQEAHMAVYRQQMMKVTGESTKSSPASSLRPNFAASLSAPQLGQLKTPSPDHTIGNSDDEDDEVPLAILQAHGFPTKSRPPTRLSNAGSNPNLRASAQTLQPRPGTSMGENSSGASQRPEQRQSTLPAFARNLPQDPFVGAGIAKPAIRESLAYAGGSRTNQAAGLLPPGGLVGVIATEERSRAMRRGSPNVDGQKLTNTAGMHMRNGGGFDPMAGIPPQMMYGQGGMPGMPGMPGFPQNMQTQPLTAGDQAQIQMSQQMQQFMEMQMQFMQMMTANQNQQGGAPSIYLPPQEQFHQPQGQPYSNHGGLPFTKSVGDLSMMQEPRLEPHHRVESGSRTMSMIHPSSMSFVGQPGYARSVHAGGQGYTPSIAPSERSTVGLPGRYRPVSTIGQFGPAQDQSGRAMSMSGGLSWQGKESHATVRAVGKPSQRSDDEDDEEGWAAMRAKREQKRNTRKTKKDYGYEAGALL